MRGDHILGGVAVALGVALILRHQFIVRHMVESQNEQLNEQPLNRALMEASPRWMRGDRYHVFLHRIFLLGAGAALVAAGVEAIGDGSFFT